jgi:hypothetical protein
MRYSWIYILVVLSMISLLAGCFESFETQQDQINADPWADPVWGLPVEGLQCRLSANNRIWKTTDIPIFKIDLQNNGKRTFAFLPANKHQFCQIQVDGKWYRWAGSEMIDSQVWPLTPGAGYKGVTLELSKGYGITLKPGRHIIRAAFTLEDVKVVSNPVGIEIRK